ncbi:glycosyltransferase [Rubrivirga sp. S365]|uniref:glycosyltransferase family 4 protein n=1 Tax=Rubrivirga sp. S365 TaxID=3076080 RepID=UPI0028C51790|nr:glycosyltransferase [Rubrivirga sp. S365]MDT7858014.1 glycosyltransferase [Rubrivirga sp. S365]
MVVVGRFPPPLDGQALATARLADLLASPLGGAADVGRVDVGAPEGEALVTSGGGVARAAHFLRLPARLRRALAAWPGAPVLWPSVSPSPLGHARDLLTVAPAFGRRPVVAVVHRGDVERLFRSPLTAATGRALVRRLAGVVFLTEGLAARCAPFVPAAKRWVVPNTIDDAAIPAPPEVEAARADRAGRPGVRLLYLSGMIPSKGYADVLDALAVLRGRGVDASATFAGRWPSSAAESAFRARVDALGVGGAVRVLGGVSDRTEVRRLYLDADAFVLPTAYPVEAQPLTVIEALAAGTPVVVTRHAGLPEMVDEGRGGRFVRAGAPAEIADAVQALGRGGTWAAASTAARARFERQFSPAVVGARWRALLARLP